MVLSEEINILSLLKVVWICILKDVININIFFISFCISLNKSVYMVFKIMVVWIVNMF